MSGSFVIKLLILAIAIVYNVSKPERPFHDFASVCAYIYIKSGFPVKSDD